MQNNEIDDGGLAFPLFEEGPHSSVGMSLRDYFAGKALPQFIVINERVTAGRDDVTYATALKVTAQQAYALADAMIAARKAGAK